MDKSLREMRAEQRALTHRIISLKDKLWRMYHRGQYTTPQYKALTAECDALQSQVDSLVWDIQLAKTQIRRKSNV